jgi:hypothetical protein
MAKGRIQAMAGNRTSTLQRMPKVMPVRKLSRVKVITGLAALAPAHVRPAILIRS